MRDLAQRRDNLLGASSYRLRFFKALDRGGFWHLDCPYRGRREEVIEEPIQQEVQALQKPGRERAEVRGKRLTEGRKERDGAANLESLPPFISQFQSEAGAFLLR